MIDINVLFLAVCYACNTWQRGFLRPNSNFIQWAWEASQEEHNEQFTAWEAGQRSEDNYAKPFLKCVNVQISAVTGAPYDQFSYPADYRFFSAARYRLNTKQIGGSIDDRFPVCINGKIQEQEGSANPGHVDPDELKKELRDVQDGVQEITVNKEPNIRFGSIMGHKLRRPTLENLTKDRPPIISQFQNGFRVYPKGLRYIQLDYIVAPAKPIYNFTINSSNDTIVYVSSGSVQLEWDPSLQSKFVARIGMKYAKSIGDMELYKTMEVDLKRLSNIDN